MLSVETFGAPIIRNHTPPPLAAAAAAVAVETSPNSSPQVLPDAETPTDPKLDLNIENQ